MLREFLSDSLRDLDESIWRNQSSKERGYLAEKVVAEVGYALPIIRKGISENYLPTPPQGTRIEDIDLEVRTFNCLVELGIHEDFQLIGALTINDLLATRNFGVKSLVDLLTSLECIGTRKPLEQQNEQLIQSQPFPSRHVLNQEDINILRKCHEKKKQIPKEIRLRSLPNLPDNLKLDKLDLKSRTYNCLEQAGFIEYPTELSGQTIDFLLSLPSFGRDSL